MRCEVSLLLLLLVHFTVQRTSQGTRPLAGLDFGMKEEPTLPPRVNSLCGNSTKAPVTECDSGEPCGRVVTDKFAVRSIRPVPIA